MTGSVSVAVSMVLGRSCHSLSDWSSGPGFEVVTFAFASASVEDEDKGEVEVDDAVVATALSLPLALMPAMRRLSASAFSILSCLSSYSLMKGG